MKSRIGCYRLMDWLSLLKFEAEFSAGFGLSSSQTVFRPDTLLTRSLAHLATSYAVRAVKRTYTLIPIKPAWIKAPGLMPGRVIDTPLMRKCR
ncbi:MAG: methyltransferase type 11 [Proteobacteria bacterium]|nr:methyltransferase type 11 [Pseudomonadota bacterium]